MYPVVCSFTAELASLLFFFKYIFILKYFHFYRKVAKLLESFHRPFTQFPLSALTAQFVILFTTA